MTTTRPLTSDVGTRPIVAFFALTFGLEAGLLALILTFPDQIEALFGPLGGTNPMFLLLVYTPAIAALLLVWRHNGVAGVGAYLSRFAKWRMPVFWWVLLLVGPGAILYTSAAINGTAGEFPFDPWYMVLPAIVTAAFVGPIEEIGWRGYALPVLQRRFTPFVASLIIGFFWALWHLPAFLLSGTYADGLSYAGFVLAALGMSFIMTPMDNLSGGSILIPALFHLQLNNPLYPDGQPWQNFLVAAVAVALVLWRRDLFLSRATAVTQILPQGR